jgi:polyphosphate kinase
MSDAMESVPAGKLPRKPYEKELARLQEELVKMQEWVSTSGSRLLVLFEGRDAAGKGGAIKRITEFMNPRSARSVALPVPTEREKTQWYFQRYVTHLPAAGEIVLFDRSWYNRAGVERVLGFCTVEEYDLFLRQVPVFERMLVEDGIILVKYWFEVSEQEQAHRFEGRIHDPMKRWKLSPTDLKSRTLFFEFSKARDEMLGRTHTPEAPWFLVPGDDKRRARIDCMNHLLSLVPYEAKKLDDVKVPKPKPGPAYDPPTVPSYVPVPDHASSLLH